MSHLQILLIALILDYILGDPEKLWQRFKHPAVIMGMMISWLDEHLNAGKHLRIKGIVAITILSIIAFVVGAILRWIPDFGLIELVVVTILLAHKSLIDHVKHVVTSLGQSLDAGRRSVARIVGRDTTSLSESEVSRAAVESAAENFSDAVLAPVFWYFVLGLPGLLLYKMVNTADSMIGHKTARYEQFGFGAARLDDILNWIPARICGALMCLVYRSRDSFDLMVTDAPLHSSPNAGWPEAAMAAILDVTLSGPRIYNGHKTDDPYLNPRGRRDMTADDITAAIAVLNRTWQALVGIVAILVFLIWLL